MPSAGCGKGSSWQPDLVASRILVQRCQRSNPRSLSGRASATRPEAATWDRNRCRLETGRVLFSATVPSEALHQEERLEEGGSRKRGSRKRGSRKERLAGSRALFLRAAVPSRPPPAGGRPKRRQPSLKCLLVADLHYDLRKFDWVVDAAGHVDLVVLAGDHLDAFSVVDRPAQTIVVQKYLRRIRDARAVADLLGQPRSRRLRQQRGAGHALDRQGAALRRADRRQFPSDRRYAVYDLPLGRRQRQARGDRPPSGPRCAEPAGRGGCGCITRRRRARRRAGTASARSATRRCAAGSRSISRIWFCPATCISRRSRPRAHGRIGSAGPGSSMPAIRSGRCHRMWWSTWPRPTPTGSRWRPPRSRS